MSESWLIAIFGVFMVIIQGLIAYILAGIKADIRDLWRRIYNHYHEIECDNADCKKVKTGNVIIPREGA